MGHEETTIEKKLLKIFLSLLEEKPPEIDPDAPLGNYGMDSLMLIMMTQNINDEFNVQLTIDDVASNLSIRALAQRVISEQPSA